MPVLNIMSSRSAVSQNDATKNESNKEMVKLKKLVDHWKEQAGLSPEAQADPVLKAACYGG